MVSYQQESGQSRDYHRAQYEFVKFMDKARHGMTTNDDVENAWKLLSTVMTHNRGDENGSV